LARTTNPVTSSLSPQLNEKPTCPERRRPALPWHACVLALLAWAGPSGRAELSETRKPSSRTPSNAMTQTLAIMYPRKRRMPCCRTAKDNSRVGHPRALVRSRLCERRVREARTRRCRTGGSASVLPSRLPGAAPPRRNATQWSEVPAHATRRAREVVPGGDASLLWSSSMCWSQRNVPSNPAARSISQ